MSFEFAEILIVPFEVISALFDTNAFVVVLTFETAADTPSDAPPNVFPLILKSTSLVLSAEISTLFAVIFTPESTNADVVFALSVELYVAPDFSDFANKATFDFASRVFALEFASSIAVFKSSDALL